MTLSFFPIFVVDVVGSLTMIVLSMLSLSVIYELKTKDRYNVVWTYFLWLCCGLTAFAISRSLGHIVKQELLFSNRELIWDFIRPFSGAVNTLMFVLVASVTLFFERIWKIYQNELKSKQALQAAHEKLLSLSHNLENLVEKRTKSLTVSEEKYRRIFEVSKDMIMVTKTDGIIVDINPAGYKILGYNDYDKSLQMMKFQDFFSEKTDWDAIWHKIEKKGFISNYEAYLTPVGSKKRRFLISGSYDWKVQDKESTIHFLVKDIEKRKLHERQMALADKLASIGQLSGGIAHGMNNPLGIILGYTQMLMRDENIETERYADLKTIEKHAKNCRMLVEDLLNFARSSKTQKDSIKIQNVIDEVLTFIQHHSEMHHITIEKKYDKTLPYLFLDEKKIKQVIINLIMNAKDAIGKSGTITISTGYNKIKKQLTIKISDTGYGIEKKNISRIFDPFFTTKPTGEGTGLGLSVSYGIIKNHGGNIYVDSELGKGSSFTVVLTAVAKDEEKINDSISSDC